MTSHSFCRRTLFGLLTGLTLVAAGVATPIALGALTPAQAQVSADFRVALDPYGRWVNHPRWGEVWVPDDRPRGWRPYKYGHWIYTDEWGWYWVSDRAEEDWGWIAYHYGRWVFDRGLGWIWVRGTEWAPAWVDWRRGSDYVGWAPLPPDEVIYEYDDDPSYWVFVRPRYITSPRIYDYVVPQQRTVIVLRDTVVINRTVVVEHDRDRGRRFAVNAGVSPAIIAAARRSAIPTYQVRPRVLAQTTGIPNAVQVPRQELGRPPAPNRRGAPRTSAPIIQRAAASIAPAASVAKPEPLRRDERGRLGSHPPRAAQGATIAPASAQQPRRPQQQQQQQQKSQQPPQQLQQPQQKSQQQQPQQRQQQKPTAPTPAVPAARPPSGAAAPHLAPTNEGVRPGSAAKPPTAAPARGAPPPSPPTVRPAPPPSGPAARPSPQARPSPPPQQARPARPAPPPQQARPAQLAPPPPQARPARPSPPPQVRPARPTPPSQAARPAPQVAPPPRPAAPAARPAAPPRPPAVARPAPPRQAPAKKPPPKKEEEKK